MSKFKLTNITKVKSNFKPKEMATKNWESIISFIQKLKETDKYNKPFPLCIITYNYMFPH